MSKSFKEEREKLLNEIINYCNEEQAIKNLEKLRDDYDCAIPGYMNSLNILSDTTYENRKHFLLELIQNADDSKFSSKVPRIKFKISDEKFVISYNENGFNINDVIAITDTGKSTKYSEKAKSNSFIGEKGIGFKSVFALADKVEIRSNKWLFSLNSKKCIVPKLIKDTRENTQETEISIYFKSKESLELISNELEKYFKKDIETFIFLQKLIDFTFVNEKDSKYDKFTLKIAKNKTKGIEKILIDQKDKINEFLVFTDSIHFDEVMVKERWENLNFRGGLDRNVSIVAPIDIEAFNGKVFCFLPTNITLPIPLYIQVDGQTKADRERLHDPDNNKWNKHLLNKLPEIIINAFIKFRSTNIGVNLIKYIPSEPGTDQFKTVIQTVINKLEFEEWVLTNDNGWVTPSNAILGNNYLNKIFIEHPEFRRRVERFLNKKFVNFNWSENFSKILGYYSIEKIDELEFLRIISLVEFPKKILGNRNSLFELYRNISSVYILKKQFSYGKQKAIDYLKKAKIFSFEGGSFEALEYKNSIDRTFYIGGSSKRETGISTLDSDYGRILNHKYTYNPNNLKDDNLSIKDDNKMLRALLELIGIKELREENLLSDLQIPLLLQSNSGERNLAVLFNIFNNFRLKKNLSDNYEEQLKKIENALFEDSNGNLESLKNLTLPKYIRKSVEDSMYDNLNIKELNLPQEFIDKYIIAKRSNDSIEIIKNKLREFLIICGIKNKITLENKTYEFHDFYNFKKTYEDLSMKIFRSGVTKGRAVRVSYVQVDKWSKELIFNQSIDSKIVAQQLKELFNNYINEEIKLDECRVEYFHKKVKFYNEKNELIAGLEKEVIPLICENENISNKSKGIKRIRYIKGINKEIFYKFGDFVLEREDNKLGYSKYLLDLVSLDYLKLKNLNEVWQKKKFDYEEVIEAAIELIKSGEFDEEFRILNKDTNRLISIKKFKLGKEISDESPMIEIQYGEKGKIIGDLFNLEEVNNSKKYETIFKKCFSKNFNESMCKDILNMLKSWSEWKIEDKNTVKKYYLNAINEKNKGKKIFLIINDNLAKEKLNENKIKNISIEISELEVIDVSKAAKELGFDVLKDSENVFIEEKLELKNNEQEFMGIIFNKYTETLNDEEKSRLNYCLKNFGGIRSIIDNIFLAKEVKSFINEQLSFFIDFPVFDYKKSSIYFSSEKYEIVEILATILSRLGFERYRSAYRDLKDFEKIVLSERIAKEYRDIKISDVKSDKVNQFIEKVQNNLLVEKKFNSLEDEQWQVGMYPEEEMEYRENLGLNLENSFENGKIISQLREKKKRSEKKKEVIKDKYGVIPKVYFKNQYRSRCQICEEVIELNNNERYISTFHLREYENKEWCIDRPYNILGLCPNCHAKAKFGGRDFRNIEKYSELLLEGDIFPVEVKKFSGDFYQVPVILNGVNVIITMSKEHLNAFATLFNHKNNS